MASLHQTPHSVTTTVELKRPGWELRTTMSVPKGPMRIGEPLHLAQSFGGAGAAWAAMVGEAAGA
jgi:hypothetical protein